MAAVDAQTLFEESKCYLCYGVSQTDALKLALLNRILDASQGSGYAVYRALLTQSGVNAPVATVLENNTGFNIVWTYSSTGDYLGSKNGLSGQFSRSKVFIASGGSMVDSDSNSLLRTYVNPTGEIEITTFDISNWTSGTGSASALDGILGSMIGESGSGTYFEIHFYP